MNKYIVENHCNATNNNKKKILAYNKPVFSILISYQFF